MNKKTFIKFSRIDEEWKENGYVLLDRNEIIGLGEEEKRDIFRKGRNGRRTETVTFLLLSSGKTTYVAEDVIKVLDKIQQTKPQLTSMGVIDPSQRREIEFGQ